MAANSPPSNINATEWAISWLTERLPSDWEVARSRTNLEPGAQPEGQQLDAVIEIRGPQAYATLVVEARDSFQPRDLERLRSGPLRTVLQLQRIPLLVVAPWLSPRTQELLAAERINFVDLTGNALIKLDAPALYLSSQGETRNPRPSERGTARLRGRKAARLIRLLADVEPPYTVGEVAVATGLTQGYVSRLLDALDREALIERSRRGKVESVDVSALIRRWAQSYDVFKANEVATFVAPEGAADALGRLAARAAIDPVVVTGSFAAVRLAPVAAPSFLTVYADEVVALADALGLLPADEGANVALMKPFDAVVWERALGDGGLRYAAPSQVAVDCLTGIGRMPSEGEALLRWMEANEPSWRGGSLDHFDDAPGPARQEEHER